jgi:uncharacterized membrane protein
MRLFGKRKAIKLIDDANCARIVETIRLVEKRTSGEVRIYVESRCRMVDAIDRAAELFYGLKMDKTDDRNGVLVYIAINDHQLALFADDGIYKRMGADFWNNEVRKMISSFKADDITGGLINIVNDVGEALRFHFPYDNDTDKNELPDDIVFGN